jgi:hypothetical protein
MNDRVQYTGLLHPFFPGLELTSFVISLSPNEIYRIIEALHTTCILSSCRLLFSEPPSRNGANGKSSLAWAATGIPPYDRVFKFFLVLVLRISHTHQHVFSRVKSSSKFNLNITLQGLQPEKASGHSTC